MKNYDKSNLLQISAIFLVLANTLTAERFSKPKPFYAFT